jgi:3-hydroxyisobutyrate dehydrogenase-like beta-hydroxyacid dehydrogenase
MAAANDKEIVGIVGVGRMGLSMLKHMIRHGFETIACDINGVQLDRAREAGASIAITPAEMAKQASFVILGVGYDDEVNEVVLGEKGLLNSLKPGSLIAVSSTVSPETVMNIDEKARAKNISVLDAPICRGRWAADNGTLLALVGGTEEVVERGRKVYSTFSSDIAHLGDVGHGQVGKAMNNLLLWINSIGLIEAGQLAQSTGIDLQKLRDALQMSSGKSQALEDWDMTTFTWALKDMQIVSQMTDKANLVLPITGMVKELVKEAKRVKRENPPPWTGKTAPLP